jgi:alkylhydroperoxidase family enzyme
MPPRLRPLEPSEWSPEVRRLLGGTLDGVASLEGGSREHSRPLNILGTIAHHPSLLGPFLGFAATLATRGVLSRRDSELLALRTAWNCRSAFEWGHHVVYARAAGLGEAEIDRVCIGPAHEGWTDYEHLLLQAADELHLEHRIEDETWKKLQEEFDEAQLVELPFVVGNYAMLSMVANATGVPLEEGLPGLPASPAAHGRVLTAPKQG